MIEREQSGLYKEVSENELKAHNAKIAQQVKQSFDANKY